MVGNKSRIIFHNTWKLYEIQTSVHKYFLEHIGVHRVHLVCGHFGAARAELSVCNWDDMAPKT